MTTGAGSKVLVSHSRSVLDELLIINGCAGKQIDVRVPSEVLSKPAAPPRLYAGAGGAGVARMALYSVGEGPAFVGATRKSTVRPVATSANQDKAPKLTVEGPFERAVRESLSDQPPLSQKSPKPTVEPRGHDFTGAAAVELVRSSLHPYPAQARPSAPPAEDDLLALALGGDEELNNSHTLRNLTPTRASDL
jgi:hypothetical protein